MPKMKLNLDALKPADILAEHSYGVLGYSIRYFENIWEARTCRRLGMRPVKVDTNHTGIVIPMCNGKWGIGEALAGGNEVTPIEVYVKQVERDELRLRFFRYIGITSEQQAGVVASWHTHVEHCPYDFQAYPGLMVSCIFSTVWQTENRVSFFCTEGVDTAFVRFGLPLCQDEQQWPGQIEQVAGVIPRPPDRLVVLREITSEIVVPSGTLFGPAVIPQVG